MVVCKQWLRYTVCLKSRTYYKIIIILFRESYYKFGFRLWSTGFLEDFIPIEINRYRGLVKPFVKTMDSPSTGCLQMNGKFLKFYSSKL